ncbi:AAA family ATPase [Amnibacterium endophyticum]|uniref:AAA family ATPase n=1 Tax=Amnibacterium endophyticum TaxID=2109337 RepID=A0ABW4LI57_9MICO
MIKQDVQVPGAVVLLMGRSFSGKSTVADELAQALDARVLGYDAINAERGLRGGDGIPVEDWLRTNTVAHSRAAVLLDADLTVVVDDTSSPRFLRDEWRQLATDSRARFVLVFIDVATEVIQERLLANRGDAARHDVIDSVMADHLDAFDPPTSDEAHLHFDDTVHINTVVAAVRAALSQ